MAGEKDSDKELTAYMIMKFDLSELGLGRREIEYDPEKPGEKEEAERQIQRMEELANSRRSIMPTVTSQNTRPTLSAMVDEFLSDAEIRRRKDKAATVRKDRDALALFQTVAGASIPIDRVTQAMANDFAQYLESRGLAPNTMNNHMGAISKFSKWVHGRHPHVGHTKLDFSTLRFKIDKRPDAQRAAFTIDEVKSILSDERMQGFKTREPHKFWMPYIAAYSGMRVEEIAQLDPSCDIVQIDGVWIFDVNATNGKQLKNNNAVRRIPVHQALINVGLLEYVEGLKKNGDKRLFPSLKAADGRLAKNGAKTVNRFIQKEIGVPKSLHSFRHTVATVLKQALVDEPLAAAVLGHAQGNITYARYGKDYLTVTLKGVIASIAYGLEVEN